MPNATAENGNNQGLSHSGSQPVRLDAAPVPATAAINGAPQHRQNGCIPQVQITATLAILAAFLVILLIFMSFLGDYKRFCGK
jgi:hypothetical protein